MADQQKLPYCLDPDDDELNDRTMHPTVAIERKPPELERLAVHPAELRSA